MAAPVTLKEIARETGYSVATVSRALSGKSRISQSTREKVRAAAKKMGYQPDPALSRLTAIRWGRNTKDRGETIAVLMDSQLDQYPWFVRQRMGGVQSRAKALGYNLTVFNLNDFQNNAARLAGVLKARGIRGVLIERIFRAGSYHEFPWFDFTAIGCGFGMERLPIPTVCNDLHEAVRQLWRLARNRGYRKIGVITNFSSKSDPYYRVMSGVALEQSAGELVENEEVVPPLGNRDTSMNSNFKDEFEEWFNRNNPDAVFLSYHTLEYLREHDALPKVGYACYDWRDDGESPITRAYQNLYASGELAVELCHLQLLLPKWQGNHGPTVHMVEPQISLGETLPALIAS